MLNVFIAIAFVIILEISFYTLILPPHDHLGSFGIIHEGVVGWLQRAWEGLCICWDLIISALLGIGHELGRFVVQVGQISVQVGVDSGGVVLQSDEELARVLGARRPADPHVVDSEVEVEDEGNWGGESSGQATQPPAPYYVVSMHYSKLATMLIMIFEIAQHDVNNSDQKASPV